MIGSQSSRERDHQARESWESAFGVGLLMTASENPSGQWESQADVDACLRETGVTRDQANRWRRERLLPPVIQKPQAYRGSTVLYPVGTCAQIRAAQGLFRAKNRNSYVGRWLWRLGFPVSESYWRPWLRRVGRFADRALWTVAHLRSRFDRDEYGETLQDRAAGYPIGSSRIYSRIKGRLTLPEERAIFFRVLSEIGLGEFKGFEPSIDETRSRDQAVTTKAFDMDKAERDEILGVKLNLVDALPSALDNTAIALSIGNFAQAAEAPVEELSLIHI